MAGVRRARRLRSGLEGGEQPLERAGERGLVVGADEDVFEMNNGCVCCTVRGDLIRVVNGLMKRQRPGKPAQRDRQP